MKSNIFLLVFLTECWQHVRDSSAKTTAPNRLSMSCTFGSLMHAGCLHFSTSCSAELRSYRMNSPFSFPCFRETYSVLECPQAFLHRKTTAMRNTSLFILQQQQDHQVMIIACYALYCLCIISLHVAHSNSLYSMLIAHESTIMHILIPLMQINYLIKP